MHSYRWLILTVFVATSLYGPSTAQLSGDPNKLLNWCLDTVSHKKEPGPEDDLHYQCKPWKDKACCTRNTTLDVHTGNAYNFEINHCGHIKNMSDACRTHFFQDHCFFECEPHIGPWVAEVKMKTRNERIFGAPLCAKDCDAWFDDCKDDFTCTDNWIRNFVWENGKNVCPYGNSCRTFKEVYKNAPNFCEMVWDRSWVYTTEDKPCMKIWFDGPNPNEKVAKKRIEELEIMWSKNGAYRQVSSLWLLAVVLTLLVGMW